MKSLFKAMCVTGVLVVGTSGVAYARTIAANSGHAQDPAREDCMRGEYYSGGVVNNACNGYPPSYVNWYVPLVVDNAGSKNVYIQGYFSTGTNCASYGWDANITGYYGGTTVYGNSNGNQYITTTSYVPDSGFLYATCQLGNGDIMYRVNWNG